MPGEHDGDGPDALEPPGDESPTVEHTEAPIAPPETDLESEPWRNPPFGTQAPPTEEEAATAVLDAPVPAQAALPLPLPVPPPASATATEVVEGAASTARPTAGSIDPHEAPPSEASSDSTTKAPMPRVVKTLLWIAGGLVAIAVLVGLFFLGQRLAGGQPPAAVPVASPSVTPTPTSTPTPTPTPTPIVGPQPAGVHEWDQLGGGECLEPYVSPWEEEFTVIDCAAPHTGQLVYRGTFPGDATTPFPGEAALASQINLLCTAPGVIDLTAARAFPDVQLQGSFPVTDEQWTTGQRHYYCFVSRSGGEALTGSIAGPGPAPAS